MKAILVSMGWAPAVWAAFLSLASGPAWAGQETLVYDGQGRLVQTLNDRGERVDFTYDPAGNLLREEVRGSRAAATIHADLTHPRRIGFPDRDLFSFSGRAGELVTVRLSADPPQAGMGLKMALTLRDRAPRLSQSATDASVLPNEVSLVLGADGEFEVEVSGQREILQDLRFAGPYTVTLEALPTTASTFAGP